MGPSCSSFIKVTPLSLQILLHIRLSLVLIKVVVRTIWQSERGRLDNKPLQVYAGKRAQELPGSSPSWAPHKTQACARPVFIYSS